MATTGHIGYSESDETLKRDWFNYLRDWKNKLLRSMAKKGTLEAHLQETAGRARAYAEYLNRPGAPLISRLAAGQSGCIAWKRSRTSHGDKLRSCDYRPCSIIGHPAGDASCPVECQHRGDPAAEALGGRWTRQATPAEQEMLAKYSGFGDSAPSSGGCPLPQPGIGSAGAEGRSEGAGQEGVPRVRDAYRKPASLDGRCKVVIWLRTEWKEGPHKM